MRFFWDTLYVIVSVDVSAVLTSITPVIHCITNNQLTTDWREIRLRLSQLTTEN